LKTVAPTSRRFSIFFTSSRTSTTRWWAKSRKDEQRRLIAEGDEKAAKSLKGSRYILTSSKQTLARKDREAEDGKILSKASSLFSKEQVVRKDGHLARYEDIIRQNKLLFTLDLIKEKLCEAYKMTDEPSMAGAISEIMDMCMATGNKHLLWFRRLLDNHFEGIIAHATYDISAGKIEGVNNRIKTLRRQGYGYPDDDYFFLKLFDASRKGYVRNPVAERIPQNLPFSSWQLLRIIHHIIGVVLGDMLSIRRTKVIYFWDRGPHII
jgi:transposase